MKPEETRQNPGGLWLAICVLVLVGLVFVTPILLYHFQELPPYYVQREQQRRIVRERVEAAGGWEVLRRDCQSLLTNSPQSFRWDWAYPGSLPLPPGLASLQPRCVRINSKRDEPTIAYIELFGAHSTGSRGIPFYELLLVCGPAPDSFTPKPDRSPAVINKIADFAYEVY